MYEVTCVDLITKKEFNKIFYREDLFKKFITKCKFSKKLKVVSWCKW